MLKKEKGLKSEANMAQADDDADFDSLVLSLYYSYSLLFREI